MTWRRKILLGCLLLFAVFFLCAAIRPLRYKVFPWTVARVLETTILEYPPWGFDVVQVEPGEQVQVPAPGGRTLPADYFRARGEPRGRILLVHGSIPKGRRFSPYRFIARSFAEDGYDVLLPDIGGYGEARIAPDALPEFGGDVAAAARALAGMSLAGMSQDGMSKDGMSKAGMSQDGMSQDGMSKDGPGTIVIGHSLGCCMALRAVLHHGLRPARLVLWDPPLSGELARSQVATPGTIRRFRGELQVEGGGVSRAADAAVAGYLASLEPLAMLAVMPEPKVRTMVALGSLIGDHRPLLDTVGRASQWVTMLDLKGVDHFLDMVSLGAEGGWLLYRPGNCRLFTGSVIRWLTLGTDEPATHNAPLEGDG